MGGGGGIRALLVKMFVETTCNATLERLLSTAVTFLAFIPTFTNACVVEPGNDKLLLGPLTFHHLALIVGGSSSIIAICLSLYLAFMHAINYTKPEEQRQYVVDHEPPLCPLSLPNGTG